MSRTLFLGCSHSMGFYDPGDEGGCYPWTDNNYAEEYSRINSKPVVIMASAGAGNALWPRFLAYALKKYNDIDEVFIQSTYWSRFPVAINPDLDERSIFPIDFFIEQAASDENIHRYSLGFYQDKHVEYFLKPEKLDYESTPYLRDTKPLVSEPDVRRSSHMYMRMWHYSNTHLEQYDYFKDILACDALCYYNNLTLNLWNINDRCFIPKETTDWLTQLKATKIAPIDAISYLKSKKHNIEMKDLEHYSKTTHDLIAKEYIPYLKEIV